MNLPVAGWLGGMAREADMQRTGIITKNASPDRMTASAPCYVVPRNFRCWLKADIQSPEIDFRFAPNNGHSEAHAGLPV